MQSLFRRNLELLEATYHRAISTKIDQLYKFLYNNHNIPLIAIGSGGAFTSATFVSTLHFDMLDL
jgi:hypothetical protein